ncbi:hypothetical protein D3C81_1632520 [compost metagenome]
MPAPSASSQRKKWPVPNKPIRPITIRYKATMKLSKRGISKINMPAIRASSGARVMCRFKAGSNIVIKN